MNLVHKAAAKGDRICLITENLDLMAKQYGLNMDYSEELDDNDI